MNQEQYDIKVRLEIIERDDQFDEEIDFGSKINERKAKFQIMDKGGQENEGEYFAVSDSFSTASAQTK